MKIARVALLLLFCAGVGFAAIEMLSERKPAQLSELYLAPDASLDFGAVAVGDRAERTVIATNAGTTPLILETATDSKGFSVFPPSLTLPPGESVALSVRFLPPNAGEEYSGRLRVIEPTGLVPEQGIDLHGKAQGLAMIHIEPASLAFGEVELERDATATLRIENRGEVELELHSIAALAPFSVSGPVSSLEPGQGADFEVSFTPQQPGIYEADMQVRSTDPVRRAFNVTLRGLGVLERPESYISLDNDRLEFGSVPVGGTATQWMSISNVGSDPLNITRIAVDGPFRGPTRGWRIEPAATYKIGFRFSPTQVGGTSGLVTIYSNDPDQGAIELSLLGAGTEGGDARTAESTNEGGGGLVVREHSSGNSNGGATSESDVAGTEPGTTDASGVDIAAADDGDFLDPLVIEPATIGEGGRLTLGTHESPITNFMVDGDIDFEAGASTFSIPSITPAPVDLNFGQYMEIAPFPVTGDIGPDGHVDTQQTLVLRDQAGNEFPVEATITTGDASAITPHGTAHTQTGSPCSAGSCVLTTVFETPVNSSWGGLTVSFTLPINASKAR